MRVAIIGGDRRMLYAAEAFLSAGGEVVLAGFKKEYGNDRMPCKTFGEAAGSADIVVLSVRPLEGEYLSTPLSDERIPMRELSAVIGTNPVFSGCGDQVGGYLSSPVRDYTAREEFAVRNAILTAEGAIGLLVSAFQGSIFGSKALVTGYGRIGRVTSRYLRQLGAEVTVAVRSESARAWASAEGMNTCDYSLTELNHQDIIINTAPAPVLTAAHVDRIRGDAVIIDLASAPGGVDAERAGERGLNFIHALALPGKTAPATAGRIIKDTICHIIKEENGGKDNCGLCHDRLLLHL